MFLEFVFFLLGYVVFRCRVEGFRGFCKVGVGMSVGGFGEFGGVEWVLDEVMGGVKFGVLEFKYVLFWY